jgi:hypothetical protein
LFVAFAVAFVAVVVAVAVIVAVAVVVALTAVHYPEINHLIIYCILQT